MGKVFRNHGTYQDQIVALMLVLRVFTVLMPVIMRPLRPELCRY